MGDARTSVAGTVIITNYNYERYVAAAIESALGQVGAVVRVVVVDDGSTDDSQQAIAPFAGSVTVVRQANRGQAAAFNVGFDRSVGEVVLFLDADDTLEPDAVAVAAAALREGCVKAHWAMTVINADGRPAGRTFPPGPLSTGDLRASVRSEGPGVCASAPTSGNAFTRRFLETVLPMPTELYRRGGGDHYLSWLAAASGPIVRLDRPLSNYRRHGANDSGHGTTDDYVDRALPWSVDGMHAVARRLDASPDDLRRWEAREWWSRLDAARRAVASTLPADEWLLVLDDDAWALRGAFGGRAVERVSAGGPPSTAEPLVAELSDRVARGMQHLLVTEEAAWWLQHYAELAEALASCASVVATTPGATLFRFSRPPGKP